MDLSAEATISSCCCERYNKNERVAEDIFTSGVCDDQLKLKARAPPRPSMSVLQSRTPLSEFPAANKAASSTVSIPTGTTACHALGCAEQIASGGSSGGDSAYPEASTSQLRVWNVQTAQ
eukprot:2699608-Pleurochrysis_carterae.AAC.1